MTYKPLRQAPRFLRGFLALVAAGTVLVGFAGTIASAAETRGKISATVHDLEGKPLAGIKITFKMLDNPELKIPPMTSNKAGRFSGFLPEGQFQPDVADVGLIVYKVVSSGRSGGAMDMEGGGGGGGGSAEGALSEGEAAGSGPTGSLEERSQTAVKRTFSVSTGKTTEVHIYVGKGTKDAEGKPMPQQNLKPGEAPPVLGKAVKLFEAGDMPGLLAETDQLIAKDPKLGEAHYLRGVALWKTGKPDQAVPALRQALTLVPKQPGVQGVLASVLVEAADKAKEEKREGDAAGMYQEAIQLLQAESQANPGSAAVLNNLIVAYEHTGQTDQAVATLKTLIAADPANDRARLHLAQVLADGNRSEEALVELDQVKLRTEEVAVTLYNIGVVLFNQKKTDMVVETMKKWLERMPDQGYLHRILGQAYLNQGKMEDALVELKEFIRLAPTAPDAAVDKETIAAIEKDLAQKKTEPKPKR